MRSPCIVAVGIAFTALLAGGASAGIDKGTAFTYQGWLLQDGVPANGAYDLRFTLWDSSTGGAVVGGPLTLPGVAVAQGLFTVPLDFGSANFQGLARWLEIEVQPPGGGGFSTLTPRQELRPSPYTVFSSHTDPANLTVLNASNLVLGIVPDARLSGPYTQLLNFPNPANSMSGTFSGNGFALTSLDAGNLATGALPDARLSGTYSSPVVFPNVGNAFTGDGSGLFNLNAQPKYVRTVVVSPVGTPTANGAALLAALAAITTASASNPWLLKLEPGVYDLGAASLVMKPFVDVEGSGELVTKITGPGNASNAFGTVLAADNMELRSLTVENTGGAAFAKPIWVNHTSPRITHVTVLSSGGTTETQGIYVFGPASPVIHDVTIRVSATGSANSFGILDDTSSSVQIGLDVAAAGGDNASAVWSCCGATPTLQNVVAVATGAVTANRGVLNVDSSPRMENVVAVGSGAAVRSSGVWSQGNSRPTLRSVTCRGMGATFENVGCRASAGAEPTLSNVLAEATATGGTQAYGVFNTGAGAALRLSRIRARASGASQNIGMVNQACSPEIDEVDASATGTGSAQVIGIAYDSASGTLRRFTATAVGSTSGDVVGLVTFNSSATSAPALRVGVASASGSTTRTVGLWNSGAVTPTLEEIDASAFGGGGLTVGEINGNGSQISVTGLTARASAPSGTIAGIYNDTANARLAHVSATASGPAGNRYGMLNVTATSTITVDRSTFSGTTNSIFNGANSSVRIGWSKLTGPVTTPAGSSTTCVFSYNGSYAAVNGLCQ